MPRKVISKNHKDTQRLAAQFTKKILRSNVIALTGDLGAGKTTFVQGFLKTLGVKQKITSPTFLIFKRYSLNSKIQNSKFKIYAVTYHVDCYRLHKPRDIIKLGFKEILKNSQNIVIIEWAEKIKKILPKNTIWIKFFHGKRENERLIYIH